MTSTWLSERRPFFLKNVVKELIASYLFFVRLHDTFESTGQVRFEELATWVGSESKKGPLWCLKDKCHQLWRQAYAASDLNASLLDWVVGSIFHEAVKLKENIYMVQYYGPLVNGLERDKHAIADKQCWTECQAFIEKTGRELEAQMALLHFLFGRTKHLLRAMIPMQADNALLVRYLIENAGTIELLWGESLSVLFGEMFPEGIEHAYCAAARSYLQGHWYHDALQAYNQALTINPLCDEARRESFHLRGVLRETEPASGVVTEKWMRAETTSLNEINSKMAESGGHR